MRGGQRAATLRSTARTSATTSVDRRARWCRRRRGRGDRPARASRRARAADREQRARWAAVRRGARPPSTSTPSATTSPAARMRVEVVAERRGATAGRDHDVIASLAAITSRERRGLAAPELGLVARDERRHGLPAARSRRRDRRTVARSRPRRARPTDVLPAAMKPIRNSGAGIICQSARLPGYWQRSSALFVIFGVMNTR